MALGRNPEVDEVDSLQRLRQARYRSIGTKETLKTIKANRAETVYIAKDAEERVVAPVRRLCREKRIEWVPVDSMRELGRACGIQVGAASAAITR